MTYTLRGADAAWFEIDESRLQTKDWLNFEARAAYDVTVWATNTPSFTDTIDVTIEIINVDEAGSVSFAEAGGAIEATLDDRDGGVIGETWRWARSSNRNGGWADLSGATSARYTPSNADAGMYLQVRVSYDDAHGSQARPGRQHQRDSHARYPRDLARLRPLDPLGPRLHGRNDAVHAAGGRPEQPPRRRHGSDRHGGLERPVRLRRGRVHGDRRRSQLPLEPTLLHVPGAQWARGAGDRLDDRCLLHGRHPRRRPAGRRHPDRPPTAAAGSASGRRATCGSRRATRGPARSRRT